jgi:hypothetical protein
MPRIRHARPHGLISSFYNNYNVPVCITGYLAARPQRVFFLHPAVDTEPDPTQTNDPKNPPTIYISYNYSSFRPGPACSKQFLRQSEVAAV